jgi:hypothetical protein
VDPVTEPVPVQMLWMCLHIGAPCCCRCQVLCYAQVPSVVLCCRCQVLCYAQVPSVVLCSGAGSSCKLSSHDIRPAAMPPAAMASMHSAAVVVPAGVQQHGSPDCAAV